jgi:hypothetical protein
LFPWSAGPGRVCPKLAEAYFLSRSSSAHNRQAGTGEQGKSSGGAYANNPFFLRESKVEDNPSI